MWRDLHPGSALLRRCLLLCNRECQVAVSRHRHPRHFGKNSNHTEFGGAEQHLKGPEVDGSLHDPVVGDAAHRWTARDVSGQDSQICLG